MTDKDKQPRSAEPAPPNGAGDERTAFGKTFLTAAGKAAGELSLTTPGLLYTAIPIVGSIGAAMTDPGIAQLLQPEKTPEGRQKSPEQRAALPEAGTARPAGGSEDDGGRTAAVKGATQAPAGEVGGNDGRTPVPPAGANQRADDSWKEFEDFMATPVGKAAAVTGLIVGKLVGSIAPSPSIADAGRVLQNLKPTDVPPSDPGESADKREPKKSQPPAKAKGSKAEAAPAPSRDGGDRVGRVALSAVERFAATMPKDTGERPIEAPPSSPPSANAVKPPADPNRSRT